MSIKDMSAAIRRFGISNGVRHLRNRGVAFNDAYRAAFGRDPRR